MPTAAFLACLAAIVGLNYANLVNVAQLDNGRGAFLVFFTKKCECQPPQANLAGTAGAVEIFQKLGSKS